jgi:hypothetical protein
MAVRTPLPCIGAEPYGNGWRATCVACPAWRGERRRLPGDAYRDGHEHLAAEHRSKREAS